MLPLEERNASANFLLREIVKMLVEVRMMEVLLLVVQVVQVLTYVTFGRKKRMC